MIISSYRYTNEATNKKVTVANDNRLRQFSDSGSGRQRFIPSSSGTAVIASRATSPNLVVDAIGGDLTKPAALQMYPQHGGPNQLWEIDEAGTRGSGTEGYYVYSIKAADTEMAWDIPYGDPAAGNYVQIFPWHGGDNQLWKIKQKEIEAVIFRSQHSNWVLDVPGFATGLEYIQHYPQNDGYNQYWEIVGNVADPVKLRSVSSGRYLTSSFITVDNDTLIFQGEASDSDAQLWELDFGPGDVGTIRNVDNGYLLSVPPTPVTTPTLVHGYSGAGMEDHQRWKMIS